MAQRLRIHIAEDPSLVPSPGILRLTSLLTAALGYALLASVGTWVLTYGCRSPGMRPPDLCGHWCSHV